MATRVRVRRLASLNRFACWGGNDFFWRHGRVWGKKSTSVSPTKDQGCPADWRDEATLSSAAARTPGVARSDDAEKLFAHSLHLIQTSLPTNSFTSVDRRYVLLFYLLVSSPSLPAYPIT